MWPISWINTLRSSSVVSMELVWIIILLELDNPREILVSLWTSNFFRLWVCHFGSEMIVRWICFLIYSIRSLSVRPLVNFCTEKWPSHGCWMDVGALLLTGAGCTCGVVREL